MAIPLANGDMIGVRIACMSGNQLGLNDVAYEVTGLVSSTGSTMENLPGLIEAAIESLYVAWLAPDSVYWGLSAQRLTPNPTQPYTTLSNTPGTNTGHTEPKQASAIIQKKTANPGRAGRGRIYVPFIASPSITSNGELSVPGRTSLTAIGTALFSTIPITFPGPGACDLVPQLMKRTPLTFTAITGFVAKIVVATQKRRSDFGKLNAPPW